MKEYRLTGWPDLDASHERIAYRRMLSDMSQRHVTLAQLITTSGLARHAVAEFLALLALRGSLVERESGKATSRFGSLRALAWLRRIRAPLPHGNR